MDSSSARFDRGLFSDEVVFRAAHRFTGQYHVPFAQLASVPQFAQFPFLGFGQLFRSYEQAPTYTPAPSYAPPPSTYVPSTNSNTPSTQSLQPATRAPSGSTGATLNGGQEASPSAVPLPRSTQVPMQSSKKDLADLKMLIMRVQATLFSKGYDPGAVDGVMSAETKAALRRF